MAIDYTQLISTAFAGGVAIYTDKKNRKNERQMRIDELNYALKMQSGDMYQTEGRDAANYANRPARYARYAGQGAVASTAALGSCAASAEFTPETIDAGWSIFIWGVVFAMVIFGGHRCQTRHEKMMLKKQTLPGGQDVRTNQPPPYISADGPSSFFKSLGLLSPASELTRGTQIPISSKNTKVKNCLVNLDRLRAKGDPHAVENYDSIALGCKSLPADKGGETIIEATQRKFAEAKRFFAPLSDIATGTVRGTGDTWKKVGSGTIGFFKGITENWKMLILFGIVASVLYITLMYKRV